jgi:hypothetical protein
MPVDAPAIVRHTLQTDTELPAHDRFSSERASAVEGAVPSLIAGGFCVDRMDVAELIFGPRKHFRNKNPHDVGGLLSSPGMDRDLDRDHMAARCMGYVPRWRCWLMLRQGSLLVEPARCPG